jgi:hypothetical protein
VKNDAEWVIAALNNLGLLGARRIFYRDADGRIDELIHKNGAFVSCNFFGEDVT